MCFNFFYCGTGAPYGDVDFCEDPEQICSSSEHKELKWVAGEYVVIYCILLLVGIIDIISLIIFGFNQACSPGSKTCNHTTKVDGITWMSYITL